MKKNNWKKLQYFFLLLTLFFLVEGIYIDFYNEIEVDGMQKQADDMLKNAGHLIDELQDEK